ncbi:hypothetical protein BCR44DRAFT_38840 [Catenaria anguillulae PL171]|uniref:Ankyrin repeat-containing domain protein n=1 Tax=Catenaria anguillulae PL171 TaxID=765915 RepID=A0A1Y2HHY9_9FUNG|nr:hypothetical protein BCR44DRAFT_38840 [Catenaria anguillulae PL171]
MNAPSVPTTMNPAAADPPESSLSIELAEPILAFCAHLLAAASSLWQFTAIAQPLNVLSRTRAPLVTRAALMQLPHVDLTFAIRHGNVDLLDFMLEGSIKPNWRPLNYNPELILPLALQQDSPHVLDRWLDVSNRVLVWNWGAEQVMRAFRGQNAMAWLERWKARGYPYLEDGLTFPHLLVASAGTGRVDVLDWLVSMLARIRCCTRMKMLLRSSPPRGLGVYMFWNAPSGARR